VRPEPPGIVGEPVGGWQEVGPPPLLGRHGRRRQQAVGPFEQSGRDREPAWRERQRPRHVLMAAPVPRPDQVTGLEHATQDVAAPGLSDPVRGRCHIIVP
jgi:hypothetical protein